MCSSDLNGLDLTKDYARFTTESGHTIIQQYLLYEDGEVRPEITAVFAEDRSFFVYCYRKGNVHRLGEDGEVVVGMQKDLGGINFSIKKSHSHPNILAILEKVKFGPGEAVLSEEVLGFDSVKQKKDLEELGITPAKTTERMKIRIKREIDYAKKVQRGGNRESSTT